MEFGEHRLADVGEAVEGRFAIGAGGEDGAVLFGEGLEVLVVINFAIGHQCDGGALRAGFERLFAGGEVEDRQSSMGQAEGAVGEEALAIRPAMGHVIGQRLELLLVGFLPFGQTEACDTAHGEGL